MGLIYRFIDPLKLMKNESCTKTNINGSFIIEINNTGSCGIGKVLLNIV
jgi:hypothetical protein